MSEITHEDIVALTLSINELRRALLETMISKLTTEDGIPEEIVRPAIDNIIQKKYKLGRPPLETEIREAISKCKTMKEAAAYIGISPSTLKRYAALYSKNSEGGYPSPILWRPTRGVKAYKPPEV